MSWGSYGKKTQGGGGLYVKLGNGDSITFVVLGKPHETHKLFPEGGGPPTDVKPGTPGADFKVIVHAFDVNAKTSRILQLTRTTFAKLDEKIGEFGVDHTFRIKRTGTKMTDTRYDVDHVGDTAEAVLSLAHAEDPMDLTRFGGIPIEVEIASTKPATTSRRQPSTAKAAEPEPVGDEPPF